LTAAQGRHINCRERMMDPNDSSASLYAIYHTHRNIAIQNNTYLFFYTVKLKFDLLS